MSGKPQMGNEKRTSRLTGVSAEKIPLAGRLSAQAQTFEQALIFVEVVALDVVKQLSASTGHCDQAAATMEVLAVRPEVIREVVDPLGQQSNLYFGRTGVLVVTPVIGDDGFFV